jgi:hypothetical protein
MIVSVCVSVRETANQHAPDTVAAYAAEVAGPAGDKGDAGGRAVAADLRGVANLCRDRKRESERERERGREREGEREGERDEHQQRDKEARTASKTARNKPAAHWLLSV